jgi:hypothetical protein
VLDFGSVIAQRPPTAIIPRSGRRILATRIAIAKLSAKGPKILAEAIGDPGPAGALRRFIRPFSAFLSGDLFHLRCEQQVFELDSQIGTNRGE